MLAEVIISDAVFASGAAFITAIILGLFGWVLVQAVRLGEVVSRLESQQSDHERRIVSLEHP